MSYKPAVIAEKISTAQFSEAVRHGLARVQAYGKKSAQMSGDAVPHPKNPEMVIITIRVTDSPAIRMAKSRGRDAGPLIKCKVFTCDTNGLAACCMELAMGCPRWDSCIDTIPVWKND